MITQNGAAISPCNIPMSIEKEAEHRIANSLQMISTLVRQRARSGQVSNPQSFLLEIADRIETVGKLHRFLANTTTGTVQLAAYLEEICVRLRGALAPAATSLSFDCPVDCLLPAKRALPLALITAELVSNSLKYAHPAGLPTKISLSCRPDDKGDLTIAYEDDGVGLPEGFDIDETGHMGMNFIRLLSEGLGSEHEWHRDPLGIRFEMRLSINR